MAAAVAFATVALWAASAQAERSELAAAAGSASSALSAVVQAVAAACSATVQHVSFEPFLLLALLLFARRFPTPDLARKVRKAAVARAEPELAVAVVAGFARSGVAAQGQGVAGLASS